jgi:hypothetical protein
VVQSSAPRKDLLAWFEPGEQQVHPSVEVLGVHRTAVLDRWIQAMVTSAAAVMPAIKAA